VTPQRILYVCGGRNFRSAAPGQKIGGVVACWRKSGHDVMLVCGGDILGADVAVPSYGAQEIHTKWYRRISALQPLVRSVSEYRDIVHDRLLLKHLETVASQWAPTLVWERSSRLHGAGLFLAKRIGIPCVLEWKDHLIPYKVSAFRRRAEQLESFKNATADGIVVESGVLRDNLAREGVPPEKILVAHNAVDADVFVRDARHRVEQRKALGVGDDEVLVGYLGSYAFYHDAVRLVLSAGILRGCGIRGIRVLMVGGGEEYPRCRAAAEQMGLLGSQIIMLPGVPAREVPALLSSLDVAVLPGSTDIICPIKILEYMSAELPTLAPDYPCNREVIRDGDTGMLFPPKDEHALADRIRVLAGDTALRQRLGLRAREEVIGRYTWKKTWGAALDEMLRRNGCLPPERDRLCAG